MQSIEITVWGEKFFAFIQHTPTAWVVEIEGSAFYSEMSTPTQPTAAEIAGHIEGVLEMDASIQHESIYSRG